MARRLPPKSKRRLPEPRYREPEDEFGELSSKDFEKTPKDLDPENLMAHMRGWGFRRSVEPYEKAKERAVQEEAIRPPEYGTAKRKKRRSSKKRE